MCSPERDRAHSLKGLRGLLCPVVCSALVEGFDVCKCGWLGYAIIQVFDRQRGSVRCLSGVFRQYVGALDERNVYWDQMKGNKLHLKTFHVWAV